MIALYLDEDSMDQELVRGLREAGLDVLTTAEAARRGSSDAEQLEFAALSSRVLYTGNARDFAALHARYLGEGRQHAASS